MNHGPSPGSDRTSALRAAEERTPVIADTETMSGQLGSAAPASAVDGRRNRRGQASREQDDLGLGIEDTTEQDDGAKK